MRSIICLNCGKRYFPKKYHSKCKYCCKKCGDRYYSLTHLEEVRKVKRRYANIHRKEQKKRSKENYYKNKEKYKEWRKKHRLENNARTRAKYIAKKYMDKVCAECSSLNNVHVHHKDFNCFNNDLENLIYLCSICHGKKHQK